LNWRDITINTDNIRNWFNSGGHLTRVWKKFAALWLFGIILASLPVLSPIGWLLIQACAIGFWLLIAYSIATHSHEMKEKENLERDQRLAKMIAEESKKNETKQ